MRDSNHHARVVAELPADAESWHASPAHLAAWVELIRDAGPLSEPQERAFAHAFDSAWRMMRKCEALQLIRDGLSLNEDVPEETKQRLFEATEAFFQGYYAALSGLAGLVARHSKFFGSVPTGSMKRFVDWLGKRFPVGLVLDLLELGRKFRSILDHPEQFPAFTWGIGYGAQPHHIFLYGLVPASGAIPPGARADGSHGRGASEWVFPAPDERWLVDCISFALMLVVMQIIEDWVDGSPPHPSIRESVVSGSIHVSGDTFYIPCGTVAR